MNVKNVTHYHRTNPSRITGKITTGGWACFLTCFLLFLSACGITDQQPLTNAPAVTPAITAVPSTIAPTIVPTTIPTAVTPATIPTTIPTPTTSQGGFAAFVSHNGGTIIHTTEQEYGNITTIHSAVDRPVALITQPYLTIPPRARGEVFIQNDSANPQTLVSDTPNGFAPFTIAPFTTTTLVFTSIGAFRSHLQAYPGVTLSIFVSVAFS
jgi:hypothetical protein